MQKKQTPKFLRLGATGEYLTSHPEKVEQVPALAEMMKQLNAWTGQIKVTDERLLALKAGKSGNKKNTQKALCTAVNQVRLQVYAYARTHDCEDTKELTRISASAFKQLADVNQATRARLILEEARKYLPELASRNITADKLDALRAAIDAFTASIDQRNSNAAEIKSANATMSALFRESDDFIRHDLNAILEWFHDSDPAFFKGYKAATRIKRSGTRSPKAASAATPGTPVSPGSAS